ncbi:MAG: ImmA/IrrE family metallo-endopeptidase [Ruminococcus sp.]|nr:ImmA/IrrE family metallo-endopeptidase [Ruminococcus sp.]
MNYKIYKDARDAAWKFLIENNIKSLPIVFTNICKKNNIMLKRYIGSAYFSDDERGIVYFDRNGHACILINGDDDLCVQRYSIAHELGHIYLGHLTSENICHRLSGSRDNPRLPVEYQAERFAMDILAPACVLWALDIHSAQDIARLCNISLSDASIRAKRMNTLYKRDKFLSSSLEKQVYELFEGFIIKKKNDF